MKHFTATLEFTTKDFNLGPMITYSTRVQIPPFTLPVLVDPGGAVDARCVDIKHIDGQKWELCFEYDEQSLHVQK